jgi:diguanylate cyclase
MVLPPQYLDTLNRVRNSLRDRISQPIGAEGHTVQVGASIGMACYPGDGLDVEALIDAADRHMYEIKRAGKLLRAVP